MNVAADAFSAESSISAVPLEVTVPNVFELLELERPEVNMTPLPSDSSRSDENKPDDRIVGVVDSGNCIGNRRSSFWVQYSTCKSHNDDSALQLYLSERPNTVLRQSKYSRDRNKKYEYRSCICGCDYRILIILDVVHGQQSEMRETIIPSDHDEVTETVPHPRQIDKEVSNMIVQLMEQNRFSKNFVPKRIMSELRRCNIAEDWIPTRAQIQNKLSYHHQTVFNFNNEIYPLQDKARLSIFTGKEGSDQPFIVCMMWMIVIGETPLFVSPFLFFAYLYLDM
jgi:hypothetical protein